MKVKIIFRNNSSEAWNNYNVGGGVFIDIAPKSVISVSESSAVVLRRNLCDVVKEGETPKWLEEISEKSLTDEEKKSLNKEVEKIDEKELDKIQKFEEKQNRRGRK